MNRSTKYVKNQELKRFNNIKGKKKYLLTSKVMNRMELSVPIILYLMFIGIVVYLMRYQGNEKIATVIDFIIAVMSVVIMVMSYIRTIITKKENANAIWIYNGIFILILSIGLVVVLIAGIKMKNAGMIARGLSLVVLIAGIKMKNAGMIARGLSLAALIYTFTLELIKTLKLYYNKNKEWENNLEEQIKKIKSDSITKF